MSSPAKECENRKYRHLALSTSGSQDCAVTGNALLRSPYLNKGSAFPSEERVDFKLHGLLPPGVQSLDEQVQRAYQQYSTRPTDLAKNTFMTSMKEQNQVLFYRLIQDHLKEMFAVIYTPTEGDAIQDYSRLFRRPEGCYLNIEDQDRLEENMRQFGNAEDVDVIVVSDGEQILGIGDQGVGAILISVAKLVLYTLCAGIHPARTLPVVLDCGTNNNTLLNDELYLGLRQPRAKGAAYDGFVAKFVEACKRQYPKSYLHFEDFGLHNARRVLEKYAPHIACFNDDVQGTGCVTLAAIMAAFKVNDLRWDDARFVIFGAGTAGTGIADQIKDAIAHETHKAKDEAGRQIWCIDKPGLLLHSQANMLTPAQRLYARMEPEWAEKRLSDLTSIVKEVKPHVLIGTSTISGAFSEQVVREMAKHVERPVILPLSNPTPLHEAKPQDIVEWTNGKALVATGSPFSPVQFGGKTYEIAECNNAVAFPGIGLGAVLSRTCLLPASLLVAAVKAVASMAPVLKDPTAGLLPDVTNVREVSVQVAKNVIRAAVAEGLNQENGIPSDDDELDEWVREQMWDARYRPLRLVENGAATASAKGEAGPAKAGRPAKFGT